MAAGLRLRRPGRLGPSGRLEPRDRIALVEVLAALPAAQRRAMVLRYLADLPVAEIADREGVPEGTVKSWLHRGRATLATRLGPAHVEVPHA